MITSSMLEPTRSRTAREANKPQVSATRWARCSRLIMTTLIVWAGLAIMPRLSSAGSITYTWQNGDGEPSSGDLVVSGAARANGQIQFADIVDFNFMVRLPTSAGSEEVLFTKGDLLDSGFPVAISTVTAGPTPQFFSLMASNSKGALQVEFDQNWNLIAGQGLALTGTNGFNSGAEGLWIITGASVPEPSTLTMSGLACIFGMVYISARKRREC
jgi:PEP-CTERM motif